MTWWQFVIAVIAPSAIYLAFMVVKDEVVLRNKYRKEDIALREELEEWEKEQQLKHEKYKAERDEKLRKEDERAQEEYNKFVMAVDQGFVARPIGLGSVLVSAKVDDENGWVQVIFNDCKKGRSEPDLCYGGMQFSWLTSSDVDDFRAYNTERDMYVERFKVEQEAIAAGVPLALAEGVL